MAEEEPHPLEHIVDDEEPAIRCLEYLCQQMLAGRSVEELQAELSESGWSKDDAEDLCEQARQQTRHERGVVTQTDVLQNSRRNFRLGWTGGWMLAFLGFASARRLLFAVRSVRQFAPQTGIGSAGSFDRPMSLLFLAVWKRCLREFLRSMKSFMTWSLSARNEYARRIARSGWSHPRLGIRHCG